MHAALSKLIGSPLRNVGVIVGFMIVLIGAASTGYVLAGWTWPDALYMVVLTIYSVGFREVRPIDTAALRALTVGVMAFGCTGMILLTGALVQVFTSSQIRQLASRGEVESEIRRLKAHVIICGFGRIGMLLAHELKAGRSRLVILERDESRVSEARALGHLCLHADATDEACLKAAGVERARVLATVLPDDAANVFITLSARSLNPALEIIARGDQPSTESKLVYAGANRVVLPTHIGAERIAEMILHPEAARLVFESEEMRAFDKTLRELGLRLEMVTVASGAGAVGATVGEIEHRACGDGFVVQIDRRGGEILFRPSAGSRIEAGDGVLMVTRADAAALTAVFQAPWKDAAAAG